MVCRYLEGNTNSFISQSELVKNSEVLQGDNIQNTRTLPQMILGEYGEDDIPPSTFSESLKFL